MVLASLSSTFHQTKSVMYVIVIYNHYVNFTLTSILKCMFKRSHQRSRGINVLGGMFLGTHTMWLLFLLTCFHSNVPSNSIVKTTAKKAFQHCKPTDFFHQANTNALRVDDNKVLSKNYIPFKTIKFKSYA
jgi:hypothetical protein